MEKNSEIILNVDGSIYHLGLLKEQLADTIFLVGDQDRVDRVSGHFDRIEYKNQRREFKCHTGYYSGHRMTVLSTGIGTDNIDIVLNELNLLVNYDFLDQKWKEDRRSLNLVRLGTSGSVQRDIEVDSLICSGFGMGLDGMALFYNRKMSSFEKSATSALNSFTSESFGPEFPSIYFASGSKKLAAVFSDDLELGITCSANGFYAPQGRNVDSSSTKYPAFVDKLAEYRLEEYRITNLEMETSGIYALSEVFGFEALSINAILANRAARSFSADPAGAVNGMIAYCLDKMSDYLGSL